MSAGYGSIDTSNCTEVTPECPVSATLYGDYFSTGGCAFFVAAYAVLILGQLVLGWRSRTWSYTAYLSVGAIFELIGYISRLRMSFNPFASNAFLLQVLFLVLAPTLIAAAISVTFKHLVLYYGPEFSTIRPQLYPWLFVGSDFVSIVIQGVGGAVAASATTGDNPDPGMADLGNNLLIAGVSFQVVNMVVCGILMLVYQRRYQNSRHPAARYSSSSGNESVTPIADFDQLDMPHRTEQSDKRTQQFIYSLVVAYVSIIIRCIYRFVFHILPPSVIRPLSLLTRSNSIPEMAAGWGSAIMRNEPTFMVFDGSMILLAVLLLTVVHPLYFFPFLSTKPPGMVQSSKKKSKKSSAGQTQQLQQEQYGMQTTRQGM